MQKFWLGMDCRLILPAEFLDFLYWQVYHDFWTGKRVSLSYGNNSKFALIDMGHLENTNVRKLTLQIGIRDYTVCLGGQSWPCLFAQKFLFIYFTPQTRNERNNIGRVSYFKCAAKASK